MCHVIWDWNGTLLDDLPVILAATNAALVALGGRPVDADTYREHYARPVKRFYERLLGRPLTDPEWDAADATFRAAYHQRLAQARPAVDAHLAIDTVERLEGSQSILSMWRHDELGGLVRRHGLDRAMLRIDGNDGIGGAGKRRLLGRHLEALRAAGVTHPARTIMLVGDSLDDADAAAAHGLTCVLYDGGSHHPRQLVRDDAHLAHSLLDALALAGLTPSRPGR